jgi:hypothetical protein
VLEPYYKTDKIQSKNKTKMEANISEKESENIEIKTYLIPLSEASKISGYTVEHLNLLCRKKILKGMKVGRNWHTTQEWLNEFLFLPKSDIRGKEYKRRKKKKNAIIPESEVDIASEASKNQEPFTNIQAEEKTSEKTSDLPVEKENGKLSWSKAIAISFSTLFISVFLFFGISFWKYLDTQNNLVEKGIPTDLSEDTFLFTEKPGVVEGEETVMASSENILQGPVSSSENYKIEQVSFGGSNITLANMDNEPLEIYDIKSESFNSKDGKQSQLLISWKTSKLSISEINYSRDGNENAKTLQEKYYGFSHNAVLAKLDMAATYNYEIKTRDRWGNEIPSGKFRAYTGSKIISVFDLIIKALSDIFGWAINRN